MRKPDNERKRPIMYYSTLQTFYEFQTKTLEQLLCSLYDN